MPLNLVKNDRLLLGIICGLVLLIVLALALASPSDQDSGIASSYLSASSGARAAFLLLQQQGYQVEHWESPPAELPADPNTILILAGPFVPPTDEERHLLQLYLARGGNVLVTGETAGSYLPRAHIGAEHLPDPNWKQYEPEQITSLTRGGAISMSPLGYWDSSNTEYLVHYAAGGRPIVVSYTFGKGKIIWWASSVPLSNAGISRSGNMALLLNSVGAPGETRVLWDEYFHGYRHTLGAYLAEPPLLVALAQCALILVGALLTWSRRNSPIHPVVERSRLSPLEFVGTLGNLYRRAHANHSALEIPYLRFRAMAARHLGLATDTPSAELARAIGARFAYDADALQQTLSRIEAAMYDAGLTESQALALAQELNDHAYNLKWISHQPQETISHANRVPGPGPRPH